jgi:hypothetical protein
MDPRLFCVLVSLGAIIVLLWLMLRLSYHVTDQALEIRLFGICLRRFKVAGLRKVSVDPRGGICERWPNTLAPRKRELFIERRTGFPRIIWITPEKRYMFKAELEGAIARARPRHARSK